MGKNIKHVLDHIDAHTFRRFNNPLSSFRELQRAPTDRLKREIPIFPRNTPHYRFMPDTFHPPAPLFSS